MLAVKPKRTANHSAHTFVDKRQEFTGSSMRGEGYREGYADSASGSWLSDYETEQYDKHRARITYVVWSFYTPIAYYVEGFGWYKVGQSFSSFTGRHRNGALRNVRGHNVVIHGSRGDWAVQCFDCGTTRHFTQRAAAERVLYPHR